MKPRTLNMQPIARAVLLLALMFWSVPAIAADRFHYQLYTDADHYGIVVFPQKYIFTELEDFIKTLGFKDVESGVAILRFGSVNRNGTYMMPESVQKKHNIDKFVILQILDDRQSIMVGIWEQEHGLTLPSSVFQMGDVRNKLPQTLDIFRKQSGKKPKTPILFQKQNYHSPEALEQSGKNIDQGD